MAALVSGTVRYAVFRTAAWPVCGSRKTLGVMARFLEGAAEVSLRRPVALDAPLDVVRETGESLRLLDGEALVAGARFASELGVEVPAPVSPYEARLAAARRPVVGAGSDGTRPPRRSGQKTRTRTSSGSSSG
jgi:hypothetical protein